jgi:two-component system sporulation sensor kinase B
MMVKDLLLQILIILFPSLFFVVIKNKLSTLRNDSKIYIGLTNSISILLCMMFPISFNGGMYFDLRAVPWLLSFLYGGKKTGLAVTFVLFSYRVYMGGMGMYPVFTIFSLAITFLFFTLKHYHTYNLKGKMLYSSSLLTCHLLLIFIMSDFLAPSLQFFSRDDFSFWLFHITANLLALWLSLSLKEMILENERLNFEVQRAEKMNIVGQLAASVAHEIRNPMTSVKGFLQLLKDDALGKEKKNLYINLSLEELDRTDTIINNYLSLAKPADELKVVEIRKEVHYVIETMTSFASFHNVGMTAEHQEEPLFIKGNSEKLRQVLINIIKNGIEAASSASNPNPAIQIRTFASPSSIVIEIEDNGDGMSEEEVKRLGMPFYSTKEAGTGLGMMVCYRIIKTMQGAIRVTSRKGEGTCFTITLPKAKLPREKYPAPERLADSKKHI